MYIKRIRLRNIRGFHDLDLKVVGENGRPRMRTIFIGKNGTCKTTLLRSVVLGLCGASDASGLLTEPIGRLVSNNASEASIQIVLSTSTTKRQEKKFITEIYSKNGKEFAKTVSAPLDSDKIFVIGYGVGRSFEGPEAFRPYRMLDSAYSLFNYEATLVSTELVLNRLRNYLSKKSYDSRLGDIKNALGLPNDVKISLPRGGGVDIDGPSIGGKIPLTGWADGYRISFAWIVDLYGWAMRANAITKSGDIKGILLIDELEQHTHPSMQMDVLPRLKRLWPELQIFGTTHSPLVALGASPGDLTVLHREGDRVRVKTDVPDFTRYSAQDVLIDERLFGAEIYGPDYQSEKAKYRTLAEIPKGKRTKQQADELSDVASRIRTRARPKKAESPFLKEFIKLREKYDL